MERQENSPEAATVVELMQSGALAGQPEWTIYEVASAESLAMLPGTCLEVPDCPG
jgi:hypothetical protein